MSARHDGILPLSPEQLILLLRDKRLLLRKAPEWTGNGAAMPEGTRLGLAKSIGLSQATRGIRGQAIDPVTKRLLPRKALAQRRLAGLLREVPVD